MNILVTGGAGFIGSHIVKHHLAKGNVVWAVDNLQAGHLKNIETIKHLPTFQFYQSDVRSWPELLKAVSWADHIYHMAGNVGQYLILSNPIDTLTNNIEALEAVLKAMATTKTKARLIIASTSELYCHSVEEEDRTVVENAVISFIPGNFLQETYPVSKLTNEIMALSYIHQKGIHCTIARIFNTIGVNQSPAYGMVVPTFIQQASSGKTMTIFGDGLQTRSFSDARDTATALNLLLDNAESNGMVVNVGNDTECSINDLAKLIRAKTNSKSEFKYIPYVEAYGIDFVDVKRRCPNLKKLKKLTNFTSKWTLEQTIEEILKTAK